MRSLTLKRSFAGGFVALLIFASGCGPGKGTVTGKVTIDGKPLKGGRIDFANKSGGRSASVEIGTDGTYTVTDITTGDYNVSVATSQLNVKGSMGPPRGKAPVNGPPKGTEAPAGYVMTNPAEVRAKFVAIPVKYEDTASSGLTLTVTGGPQTYDIPLTGK